MKNLTDFKGLVQIHLFKKFSKFVQFLKTFLNFWRNCFKMQTNLVKRKYSKKYEKFIRF